MDFKIITVITCNTFFANILSIFFIRRTQSKSTYFCTGDSRQFYPSSLVYLETIWSPWNFFEGVIVHKRKSLQLFIETCIISTVVPRHKVLCFSELVGPLDENAKTVWPPHAPLSLYSCLFIPGPYLQQNLFMSVVPKS